MFAREEEVHAAMIAIATYTTTTGPIANGWFCTTNEDANEDGDIVRETVLLNGVVQASIVLSMRDGLVQKNTNYRSNVRSEPSFDRENLRLKHELSFARMWIALHDQDDNIWVPDNLRERIIKAENDLARVNSRQPTA